MSDSNKFEFPDMPSQPLVVALRRREELLPHELPAGRGMPSPGLPYGLLDHETLHDSLSELPQPEQRGSLQFMVSLARKQGDRVPERVRVRINALQQSLDTNGELSGEEEHERHALFMYLWDNDVLAPQLAGMPAQLVDTHFCQTCHRDRLKFNLPPLQPAIDSRQTRLIEMLQSGTSNLPADLVAVKATEIAAAALYACFAARDRSEISSIEECARKMMDAVAAHS